VPFTSCSCRWGFGATAGSGGSAPTRGRRGRGRGRNRPDHPNRRALRPQRRALLSRRGGDLHQKRPIRRERARVCKKTANGRKLGTYGYSDGRAGHEASTGHDERGEEWDHGHRSAAFRTWANRLTSGGYPVDNLGRESGGSGLSRCRPECSLFVPIRQADSRLIFEKFFDSGIIKRSCGLPMARARWFSLLGCSLLGCSLQGAERLRADWRSPRAGGAGTAAAVREGAW
jgi:hypothetical protein